MTIFDVHYVGYTYVNAYATNGKVYRKMIEVQFSNNGQIEKYPYVVDISSLQFETKTEDGQTTHIVRYPGALVYGERYLLKTGTNLVMYEDWDIDRTTDSEIINEGINFAIYDAIETDGEKYVTDDWYDRDLILFQNLNLEQYVIELCFEKDSNLCLPQGIYAMRNFNEGIYVQLNDNSGQEHVELHTSNGDVNQEWRFIYFDNVKAYAIQSVADTSKALTLSTVDLNEKISVKSFNVSNPLDNQLWKIKIDTNGYYKLYSYADIDEELVMGANNGITNGINGLNVVMKALNGSNTDWEIEKTRLDEWHYRCSEHKYGGTRCKKCRFINYWGTPATITVSMHYLFDDTNNQNPLRYADFEQALNDSVSYLNEAVGIPLTVVGTNLNADIIVYIANESMYYNVTEKTPPDEADVGGVVHCDYHLGEKTFLLSSDEEVTVRKLKNVTVGIFVHNVPNQMRYTMLHELTHAIGLFNHSPIPSDLMYGAYTTANANKFELSSSDINTLKFVYERFV